MFAQISNFYKHRLFLDWLLMSVSVVENTHTHKFHRSRYYERWADIMGEIMAKRFVITMS